MLDSKAGPSVPRPAIFGQNQQLFYIYLENIYIFRNSDQDWQLFQLSLEQCSKLGNIYCTAGPLWGESIGHLWIPVKRVSILELWCFLCCKPDQSKMLYSNQMMSLYEYSVIMIRPGCIVKQKTVHYRPHPPPPTPPPPTHPHPHTPTPHV